MGEMLGFQEHYGTEAACIEALAHHRWLEGYVCPRCAGGESYQLKSRCRVFECSGCGHQESVTAGTIFHRTRTPLRKWLLAVWWRPVAAGKGIKESGFAAGRARLVVLAEASQTALGGFVREAVRPGSHLLTDGFSGYGGLGDAYRHHPAVQGKGKNAERLSLIVHVLFSNVKTWLNGTYHGVGAKHLPRYVREWNYRFNRRARIADMVDFVLGRAMTRPTITYRELVNGMQPTGTLPAVTG